MNVSRDQERMMVMLVEKRGQEMELCVTGDEWRENKVIRFGWWW